jgi:hypothetical protein
MFVMEQWFDIPARSANAVTGSQFIQELHAATIVDGSDVKPVGFDIERDDLIFDQVTEGNIPPFMRIVQPVKISDRITIYVLPDYLCVGSDDDYVMVPLNPMTAQRICDRFKASLPTRKMVDAIWHDAVLQLEPMPWGPPYDASMMSTDRFDQHSQQILKQFKDEGGQLGTLIGGSKKDVVLSLAVQAPQELKVAIYGWHKSDGSQIQGPGIQAVAHEITYRDYAHGIRLVSLICKVDGKEMLVTDVLKDVSLVSLLSDEKAGNTGVRTESPDPFTEPRYVTTLSVA